MPRVLCLPRDKHDSVLGAVKRHSKGDAGADGGFDGSGIAFGRSALIREVPDVRAGTEAESWHARGGIGPHPQSNCTKRGHVAPSLLFAIGDSRSASRPPIAFAVARFDVIPAKAGIRPSIEVSVSCGPGQIRACAGTTEFGR